jgi:hypothetical protein
VARYILIATVVGQPPGWTYTKWGRGRTIADTAGNALPGDVVWPALCDAANPVNMAPLDAAASAVMGLPITTLAALSSGNTGVAGADVGT